MEDVFSDDRALTVAGLVIEVHAALVARLDAVHAAAGLAGTDFDVLFRLARSPGERLRMTDLAAQTGLSNSGITRIVDRVEGKGLAARQPSPDDRRSSVVLLTDEGRALLAEHVPMLARAIDEAFYGELDEDAREHLFATLTTVRNILNPNATAGA
ncbi:MarR family winged helix-turn-helix transcriptional regulator [Allokutzneria sp. NRRL B-24872]|uniref:MarR family winged helix-turn-helix transcriptional regulator n=1 Tax=Allokutzneria sp. NRRL B-24872 TaxID=1137961 RepID=UPI000A390260|nr:MarR family transcriptional regulator [Allokutzneria sp. NRRL B-24872]